MGRRGEVTVEIKELAKELLDIEDISTEELRLMPYIQYLVVNSENLNPSRINSSEREVFQTWKKEGWVSGGMRDLQMSKEFWDAVNEILWIAYATCDK